MKPPVHRNYLLITRHSLLHGRRRVNRGALSCGPVHDVRRCFCNGGRIAEAINRIAISTGGDEQLRAFIVAKLSRVRE
jgi:hypothetical protein